MRRLLLTAFILLAGCLTLGASQPEGREAAKVALTQIDQQIAREQQQGNEEKEGEARWQKMVTLKNFSQTEQQATEADVQMAWFRSHGQWDYYYRTWQLKANALCALGRLQKALQETQQMLNDAKGRGNKLGRAMAYKQIGIIYLNMKQTVPAIEALRHYAELMKDEEDDIGSLSNIYYRVAKAYDYDKTYDKELRVTDGWLDFLHEKAEGKDPAEFAEYYHSCYLARTASYIGLERLDDAALALDTATYYVSQCHTALSRHHYYKMQARYQMARGDAARTLLYTDSVKMITNEKDDHTDELRAQALLMLGQGTEAAAIYQRLYHEKDSVFGHDARQHLDELNALFQIDELKTEQQRTKLRYTLLTAFSIMLALLLLLFYGWRSAIRQKKANEQLRIANERAEVSSKMKTEFIHNISHEIRTPLNIVSGFTQILTTPGMDLPDAEKSSVQKRVIENTDRITKLVDRMLELSDVNSETIIERNDQTDAQKVAAQAVAYARMGQYTRPANAEAAVSFECPAIEPVPLLTNQQHAARALAQLLENAVKFTHEGCITLRMEHTSQAIRFIVEDTGIGIPSDQAEDIFQEFIQLDSFTDGTGIGLSVARSIARRMGGDLWLDASYRPKQASGSGSPATGARFVLELLSA